MTVEPYNFRNPSRLTADVGRPIADWQSALCTLLPERWARHLSYEVEVKSVVLETAQPAQAGELLPDPAVGYQLAIGDERTPTVFVFPRQLALALLLGMLAEPADDLPEDRELTQIELSLSEVIVQDLVAALKEAWPEATPLSCTLIGLEHRLPRLRLYRPDETLVILGFGISGPFGTENCFWLVPMTAVTRLISQEATSDRQVTEQARRKLEALVREFPVELVVRLGKVKLHVSELAHLRRGDVIVLDQRVTEPLVAEVAGRERFTGWPGSAASRQTFQIVSFVEP